MILHEAATRGFADHGWLKSYHSFSFAQYYNPERIHFGVLRVLNDDWIAGGMGFGMHPHDNMEIITIGLEGALEHKDSMGNTAVIRQGDIQVMSAGTGIYHSEFNHNKDKETRILQIWVFPNKKNVQPRYDQISIRPEDRINKFQQIISPHPGEPGVWIHQDAWFYLGHFEQGQKTVYHLKKSGNGLYIFIISGQVVANGQVLSPRDGLGIRNLETIQFEATTDTEILLMDLPMAIS